MRIAIAEPSRRLAVENVPAINILFPQFPVKNILSGAFRILPHTSSMTKVIRNLGGEVAAPIYKYYNWSNDTPFDSQKQTAAMLTVDRRGYVLSSMGVGKTRAAIYAFDFLRQEGEVKRMLVVAPLSTLVSVWQNEVFEAFPQLRTEVLHGDRKTRAKRLATSHADIFIINHDGVKVMGSALVDKFEVICIDEAQEFRNARTDMWKCLNQITAKAPYVWGLTGSPRPNDPTDAHGVCRLVTPESVPRAFRLWRMQVMDQITQFKWVPKPDANEKVFAAMQPAVRFRLEDCHDLPPQIVSARDTQMCPKQALAYKQMLAHLVMEAAGGLITAANEGVKLQKLLQVASGFVYNADKSGTYLGGKDRFKQIIELIHASEKKVIVFSQHRWMVDAVTKVLNGVGISAASVHGGTSSANRTASFTEFQSSPTLRVLSAHPGTIALGLTLTAASTILWNGPPQRAMHWSQGNARIHRRGQDSHTQVICLSNCAVERRQFKRVRNKQDAEGLLLDMYKQGELSGI